MDNLPTCPDCGWRDAEYEDFSDEESTALLVCEECGAEFWVTRFLTVMFQSRLGGA